MNLEEAAVKAYARTEGSTDGGIADAGESAGVTVSDFDISLEELKSEMALLLLNARAKWNQIMDADPDTSVNELLDGIVVGAWHHGLITGLIKERG